MHYGTGWVNKEKIKKKNGTLLSLKKKIIFIFI